MSFDMLNFTVAAPLLALAAGALVVLLLDLLLPAEKAQGLWYLFSLVSVALAGYYMVPLWGKKLSGFDGMMVMDQFALVFGVILLITTGLTILLSFGRTEIDKSGYLALVLWAAMGMLMMTSASNLMTIFLGLELLSLALYVMVAFDAKRLQAREAALKYFVLGSMASGFLLFGFGLIYGASGSMDLATIASSFSAGDMYFKVGLGLVLVGFAFKMAMFPFHAWAPDVYQGAPTPVTAFMSVGTKSAAFAALARVLFTVVPAAEQPRLLFPLAILAAASMLLGSTVGIWQNDLKRLMGYSGIAHAGYLMMAIPGLGEQGLSAAAYYLMAYGFTAMGIFAVVVMLENEGVDGSDFKNLKGLFYRRPWLGVALAVLMFGLAGIPPTGGFIGKFLLFKAAVTGIAAAPATAWTVLIGLIVSTGISAYVYLRVIGVAFSKEEKTETPMMAGASDELALSPGAVRVSTVAVLVISVVGILWLGILPGTVVNLLTVGF